MCQPLTFSDFNASGNESLSGRRGSEIELVGGGRANFMWSFKLYCYATAILAITLSTSNYSCLYAWRLIKQFVSLWHKTMGLFMIDKLEFFGMLWTFNIMNGEILYQQNNTRCQAMIEFLIYSLPLVNETNSSLATNSIYVLSAALALRWFEFTWSKWQ